CARIQSYFDYW
nr:immunoglobulin heavy chain junction region [Macaca mulatta]MOV47665.1 immunoglobulin heavy chain junction region [Macaca mulatta]MOV48170.1 immunoglobulin heavy chain junction region [Macaca mulatta]MOV48362.1 immunoglobulin heavy chain junction region [Macaca mulatta]MOV48571.1 immunoglobulin heavy chain junction region [Macaca mulatta]